MKTIHKIIRNTIYGPVAFAAILLSAFPASADVTSASGALKESTTFNNVALMPLPPVEATFDDGTDVREPVPTFPALAPSVPVIADFSDETLLPSVDIAKLAPVTPGEADFGDEINS
jgi:hypothetical protein